MNLNKTNQDLINIIESPLRITNYEHLKGHNASFKNSRKTSSVMSKKNKVLKGIGIQGYPEEENMLSDMSFNNHLKQVNDINM